jgi:UDP-3-O-[3-hydroxymyristoyl] N-acetylglucosamine deacetylase
VQSAIQSNIKQPRQSRGSGGGIPAVLHQRTLKSSIGCSGVGLHSGRKIAMTLHPAEADHGVVFRRSDVGARNATVPADWRHVVDTRMATTVANDAGVSVGTIEHLMAALAGCGVDNAVVELDGPEVPVMDGSAAPFVFLIECAGVTEQDAPRRAIKVLKPVSVGDDRRSLTVRPARTFAISFEIDFESRAVARQALSLKLVNGAFKTDIARARTFGFEHEVSALRAAGLALGGSLDNAVVVRGDTVLYIGGLRYGDEFVRHKILDCVGDLYLAGAPIIGAVDGTCSGHALNHRLLQALFADSSAWRWVDQGDEGMVPMGSGWAHTGHVALA